MRNDKNLPLPLMQNAALQKAGIDAVYVPILVTSAYLSKAVHAVCGLQMPGSNLMIRHTSERHGSCCASSCAGRRSRHADRPRAEAFRFSFAEPAPQGIMQATRERRCCEK